jgi:hypothetical protein
MQDKKPIAFYSRKLNTAQKRYTTTERGRELLSAIETCKEYKNILLGYPIIVFTDHKNNTFNGLKDSDRVLRCLLLLEEYWVTFEYLPGKKNFVADALSRLDIDSLKIQEEEVLTLLSGSENNSISNIKFPIHTALIFKEQAKVKEPWLREKGLAQPHYSIQHIEGYDFLCCKKRSTFLNHWDKQQRVLSWYHEYLLHPGQTKTEKNRLSGIPWHVQVLHKILNIDCLCSTCQVCQMTKKERKKNGLLPPKTAESDIVSLVHGMCGSCEYIYNKDTSQNTLSACTHNDRSSHWLVWNCWSHK